MLGDRCIRLKLQALAPGSRSVFGLVCRFTASFLPGGKADHKDVKKILRSV